MPSKTQFESKECQTGVPFQVRLQFCGQLLRRDCPHEEIDWQETRLRVVGRDDPLLLDNLKVQNDLMAMCDARIDADQQTTIAIL